MTHKRRSPLVERLQNKVKDAQIRGQRTLHHQRAPHVSQGTVAQYWFTGRNAGDAFSPTLTSRLLGLELRLTPARHRGKIVGLGSIGWALSSDDLVLGSGFVSHEVKPTSVPKHVLPVRGPLGREALGGRSVPKRYGDPGLLIGEVFRDELSEHQPQGNRVGVIPHCLDSRLHAAAQRHEDLRISVRLPPLDFAKEIMGCRAVLSSSLHRIAFAKALGVPARWLETLDEAFQMPGSLAFNFYRNEHGNDVRSRSAVQATHFSASQARSPSGLQPTCHEG